MVLCNWTSGMQQNLAKYLRVLLDAAHIDRLNAACNLPTAAAALLLCPIIDNISSMQLVIVGA